MLVLQHPTEFRRKTFSTVPLLSLVLEGVRVEVGRSFEALSLAPVRSAIEEGRRISILFPGPGAISLDRDPADLKYPGESPSVAEGAGRREPAGSTSSLSRDSDDNDDDETGESGRRNLLILVDGTWTQAASMVRNSPSLFEHCEQVQFASDSKSIYDAVRREPKAHCISTLEACARALTLLEPNNPNVGLASNHLHAALQSLVEKQLLHTRDNFDSRARFVYGRDESAEQKRRRRTEIQRELFGECDEDGGNGAEDCHQREETPRWSSRSASLDLGDGATLRPLRFSDAPFVVSRWPYSSEKSLELTRHQIEANSAVCLGVERRNDDNGGDNHELCAFILRYHNGALGMLHVEESCRRRGYGSALLSEATRVLENRGEPRQAFIVDGNRASEALFAKQGWIRADPNAKRGTGKRRAKREWIKPS